jgi:hypothetical protein
MLKQFVNIYKVKQSGEVRLQNMRKQSVLSTGMRP